MKRANIGHIFPGAPITMILKTSPNSPFCRKVKIVATYCCVSKNIVVETADTHNSSDAIRKENPLGKVPALILSDGKVIYDSHVICEYLDNLHEGPKMYPGAPDRWAALTLAALGDGILEASILQVYETVFRPVEKTHDVYYDHQAGKVSRALSFLEENIPAIEESVHIGHVTIACALGYLDFRFKGHWRNPHPRLARWLETFEHRVPSYAGTRPHF